MVELQCVVLGYKDKIVINNFSYNFKIGKLYAISGPSGAGKTTLLNAIGGILKPKSGNIYYEEKMNLSSSVTFVYQDTSLIDSMTVLDNIKLMISLANVKYDRIQIYSVLAKLNVQDYLNTKVALLSGGERQRINIAIAILRDSKIILCDEPDSNLDEENVDNVMSILKELSLTKLVIFSSHKHKALEFADEVITTNMSVASLEEVPQYLGCHKIKFKSALYVYFKGLKNKLVNFLFSFIIFALMIFVLTYFYSLSHYDKQKSLIYELNANPSTDLLIKTNLSNLYENDIKFQYYKRIKVVGSDLGISNFSGEVFNGIVIDDSLVDNEALVTDYSLDLLRNNNLLTFENYSECIGKEIDITYYKNNVANKESIKIKNYVNTGYKDINQLYSNIDSFTKILYINASTYFQFFCRRNIPITLASDKYKIEASNQYNLLYNEVLIGKDVINYMKGLGYDFNVNYGSIDLYVSGNDKQKITVSFDFKYDESVSGIYVNESTLESMECEMFKKYYTEYNEFDEFLIEKDKINTIAHLYATGSEIEFINSSNYFQAISDIDDNNALFDILKMGLVILTISIVTFSYYSFYRANTVRFQILELYGLPKAHRLFMPLCSSLFSSIISLFASAIMIYMTFKTKCQNIIINHHLISFYRIFNINYLFYMYLIGLGIIIGVFILFIPYNLKRKQISYISK